MQARRPGPAGLPSLAPFVLLLVLVSGCLGGGPVLQVVDLQGSDASYDAAAGRYEVAVRGRVVNPAPEQARFLRVALAVAPDCFSEPSYAFTADIDDLAAGASRNLRESFTQSSPRLDEPALWAKVTSQSDRRGQVACVALRVG